MLDEPEPGSVEALCLAIRMVTGHEPQTNRRGGLFPRYIAKVGGFTSAPCETQVGALRSLMHWATESAG
jgi:hypothetical protein